MTFESFLNQAWGDHGKDPSGVAARFEQGLGLLEKNEQIPGFANLIAHVFGEHLGKWDEGISFLKNLRSVPFFDAGSESEKAVRRLVATLELAKGNENALAAESASDRIRILAIAASALSEQKQAERAERYFQRALEISGEGLAKEDPANRALAVTGNNLACALEEKKNRSESETCLMILAARTGRKFWEIAGTWKEVLWAEYRLANSHLQAGDSAQALVHARLCLEIGERNGAAPLEAFFGNEILARAEKARSHEEGFAKALSAAREKFSLVGPDDQAWCAPILQKLES